MEHTFTELREYGVSEENLNRIRPELEVGHARLIIEDERRYKNAQGDVWPVKRTGILDERETAEAERLFEAFRKKNIKIRSWWSLPGSHNAASTTNLVNHLR